MIESLDHIALSVTPREAGIRAYETLLGRRAEGGSLGLANMRLKLSEVACGDGLPKLAFAVRDLAKAHNLLERRALPVAPAADVLDLAMSATHGVPIKLVAYHSPSAKPASPLATADERAAVLGLDHVVIRSPNPERAIAFYAGRLGLSLRLDRTEPAWGMRLVFFRCGDLIVEVAHDLKAGIGDGPDSFWGLSWRVSDIAAAQARLRAAGVDVSDIRTGRRPGTRVFTVKSHTCGVPTLMIGHSPRDNVLPSHSLNAT